jgi:hypothetical protein
MKIMIIVTCIRILFPFLIPCSALSAPNLTPIRPLTRRHTETQGNSSHSHCACTHGNADVCRGNLGAVRGTPSLVGLGLRNGNETLS